MFTQRHLVLLVSALVFTVTVALYWQTRNFEFLNYDDEDYVTRSEVTNGLTAANFKWAFTGATKATANWHPLTVLSLMADVSISGVDSGGMHLHSALLHAVNAVLLFWVLLALFSQGNGSRADAHAHMAAALIGTLFWATHPLRAESVAWISSRKDVLCVFWFLSGTLLFVRKLFQRASDIWLTPVMLVFYLAAFMSKPTAIVFPVILGMIEYLLKGKVVWPRFMLFAIFAVLFAAVTIYSSDDALQTVRYPGHIRLQNAIASYGHYVVSTVWPAPKSIFFPYRVPVPIFKIVTGAVVLAALGSLIAWPLSRRIRRELRGGAQSKAAGHWFDGDGDPMIIIGIWWFLITLVPVIGIIHAGEAAHADRYTYFAGIGLTFILASLWLRLARRLAKSGLTLAISASLAVIVVYATIAYRYIGQWSDSVSIFKYALKSTKDNHVAECNLGADLFSKKKYGDAVGYYCRMTVLRGVDYASVVRLEYVLWHLVKESDPEIKSPQSVMQMALDDGDPFIGEKLFGLACIGYYRKLYAAAESHITSYLKKKPEDEYAKKLYKLILAAQAEH